MYLRSVLLLAVAVSFTTAAPTASEKEEMRKLPALIHEEVHDEQGQYTLHYVTVEGTIVKEKGRLVPNLDGSGLVMIVEGEVIYIGDDGNTYKTVYTAGLDGYKVIGEHLPVPPPQPVVEVAVA